MIFEAVRAPARRTSASFAIAALSVTVAWLATSDEQIAVGIAVLIAMWAALDEVDQPPVLRLALTFQWTQVMIGPLYFHVTGRRIPELDRCDYHPMVWMGLGCIVALTLGLIAGRRLVRSRTPGSFASRTIEEHVSTSVLTSTYVVLSFVSIAVPTLAFSMPAVTQLILAMSLVRYAMLYLVFRRLLRPVRPLPFVLVMLFEIAIGLTGFFVGFREAFAIAAIALLEIFDRRRIAHWAALITLGLSLCLAGVIWTGVKQDYRRSWIRGSFGISDPRKFERLSELAGNWLDADRGRALADTDGLVRRLWAMYYPSLAVARVPAVVPHTEGALLTAGIEHIIQPRLLYPEKAALDSDSEMVRRYSGVWVAGTKRNTSIAFGYAGEMYVDFGVPLMWLPIFLFALGLGAAHRYLQTRIDDEEIAAGVVIALFWTALFSFERSWVRTLGVAVTTLIVVGSLGLILDLVLARALARRRLPVRLVHSPPP